MPHFRTYNLFISHGWYYNYDYERLIYLLNEAPNFKWKNYSVSENYPLGGSNKKQLSIAIDKQLRLSSAVLIIGRIYVAYRRWIKYEIDLADRYNKPIIGIRPYRSKNFPTLLQRDDIEVVNWNTSSIIEAIINTSI